MVNHSPESPAFIPAAELAADPALAHGAVMPDEEFGRYARALQAVEAGELPEGVKRDFSVGRNEQLKEIKEAVESRLALDAESDARADTEKRRSHRMNQQRLRSQRERLLDDKLHEELVDVRRSTQAEAEARLMGTVDERLAQEHPDKVNQYYARKQFEEDARKGSRALGEAAARQRQKDIERKAGSAKVGKAAAGAAAIDFIKREEQTAAEKAAWKQRMGIGVKPAEDAAVQPAKKELPEWAKLERPAHVSYKEWLATPVKERFDLVAGAAPRVAPADLPAAAEISADKEAELAADMRKAIDAIYRLEVKERQEGLTDDERERLATHHGELAGVLALRGDHDTGTSLAERYKAQVEYIRARVDATMRRGVSSPVRRTEPLRAPSRPVTPEATDRPRPVVERDATPEEIDELLHNMPQLMVAALVEAAHSGDFTRHSKSIDMFSRTLESLRTERGWTDERIEAEYARVKPVIDVEQAVRDLKAIPKERARDLEEGAYALRRVTRRFMRELGVSGDKAKRFIEDLLQDNELAADLTGLADRAERRANRRKTVNRVRLGAANMLYGLKRYNPADYERRKENLGLSDRD